MTPASEPSMRTLIPIPTAPGVGNVVRDFMYGCWCGGRHVGGMQMPPLSLLALATLLRDEGHDVDLVDGSVEPERFERACADAGRYDLAILLTSTEGFRHDARVCQQLKSVNHALKTILYGSHPTFMPQPSLAAEGVDIVVRHEPEFAVRDIARCLDRDTDWRQTPGIGYRDGDRIVLRDPYPPIEDLDALPIPDRSLLPRDAVYFNPVVRRTPYTTMETSRGCPARCTFCTVPPFFGRQVRVRSAERVLEELFQLVSQGYREVFIRDETFVIDRERNRRICQRMIDTGLDLTWICNARVDALRDEDVALMRRAGCHLIKFGVESGDQAVLDRMGKGIRLEQTRAAFQMCRRHGVDAHAHVMLGCPGETRATLDATLEFVLQLDAATASFGIFTPFPGTAVFDEVARRHPEIGDGSAAEIGPLHVTEFYNRSFTELTPAELERAVRTAYRRFYLRPRYLWRRLRALRGHDELRRWSRAAGQVWLFGFRGEN